MNFSFFRLLVFFNCAISLTTIMIDTFSNAARMPMTTVVMATMVVAKMMMTTMG